TVAHLVDVADRGVEQASKAIGRHSVLQLTYYDLLHLFDLGRAAPLALCWRQLGRQFPQFRVTVLAVRNASLLAISALLSALGCWQGLSQGRDRPVRYLR